MSDVSYKSCSKRSILDLTGLKKDSLETIHWNKSQDIIDREVNKAIRDAKNIVLDNSRGDIRETLPLITRYSGVKDVDEEVEANEKLIQQPRYDYSHAKKEKDEGKLVSGFPKKFTRGHYELKRVCGNPSGSYVGFMDDNTPVRIKQDTCHRMSNEPDRIWFQLRPTIIDVNLTKVFNGAPDKYGYCAYDLPSAKATFSWFAITKALNGVYPVWANQYDLWKPNIKKEKEKYWYSLCFAFGLAENRCVVTKFEKDNPVKGAPEIFVNNPLCPTNDESFWSTILNDEIVKRPSLAYDLVKAITDLYDEWNIKYCKGKRLENIGLQDESYFKYFDYADFLTPHSGLIQIRKYAELKGISELTERFKNITELSKKVKEEIHSLLVNDFNYFGDGAATQEQHLGLADTVMETRGDKYELKYDYHPSIGMKYAEIKKLLYIEHGCLMYSEKKGMKMSVADIDWKKALVIIKKYKIDEIKRSFDNNPEGYQHLLEADYPTRDYYSFAISMYDTKFNLQWFEKPKGAEALYGKPKGMDKLINFFTGYFK